MDEEEAHPVKEWKEDLYDHDDQLDEGDFEGASPAFLEDFASLVIAQKLLSSDKRAFVCSSREWKTDGPRVDPRGTSPSMILSVGKEGFISIVWGFL